MKAISTISAQLPSWHHIISLLQSGQASRTHATVWKQQVSSLEQISQHGLKHSSVAAHSQVSLIQLSTQPPIVWKLGAHVSQTCVHVPEYLPWNYPLSHDRALVQINTANNTQSTLLMLSYWLGMLVFLALSCLNCASKGWRVYSKALLGAVGFGAMRQHYKYENLWKVFFFLGYLSSLSGSSTPRLPGASFPSADRVAALLLLASEAWVGVSRRLRTPPSTVLDGGLRATRPK